METEGKKSSLQKGKFLLFQEKEYKNASWFTLKMTTLN